MKETTMTRTFGRASETSGGVGVPAGAAAGVEALSSPTACIELDRFCEECSYNLRTLPVVNDPRTGIPVVRCTECGRFQPANTTATALRPWLGRLTAVTLFVWMGMLLSAFIWLGVAEGAMSYSTLDELTHYTGRKVQNITIPTGVGTTRTIRTYAGGERSMQPREDIPYYRSFVALVLFVSFLIAMVTGVLSVVAFPHWRRVAYLALVFTLAIGANATITVAWKYESPLLLGWAASYIIAHLGAQLLGGAFGVVAGRPMTRLGIRMLLPPSVRPRLAYLWLADGKAFPSSQ